MNPTEITYIKNSKNSNNITKNFPKWEIEGGDGFQSVKFTLKPGQDIYADGGKMNYMSDNIEIRTETTGLFGGIMKMVSGSSFFYNIFLNPSDNNASRKEFVQFSGVNPGSIGCFYIPVGRKFIVVSDSYVCSTNELKVSGIGKMGGVILGYGLFYVSVEAIDKPGLLWVSSFGNIIEIPLAPNESVKVDNGVLLGLDDSIDFESASIGGIYSTIFSGEGFVTRITNNTANRQTVYLESRSKSAYLGYLKKNLMIK